MNKSCEQIAVCITSYNKYSFKQEKQKQMNVTRPSPWRNCGDGGGVAFMKSHRTSAMALLLFIVALTLLTLNKMQQQMLVT
jgi:hypothetical protein